MSTHSILDTLLAAAAAGQRPCFAIKPTLKLGRHDALLVGVDNGNDAIKAAVLAADGTLQSIRVPAALRAAQQLLAAEQEISYAIDGQRLWIGETALAHEGDALPIGPTRQRLIDPRQRQLLAATLVELLRQAGYAPGQHSLVLGFAVPNTEIIVVRDEAGQERRTVDEATRAVLEQQLKGAVWPVRRILVAGRWRDIGPEVEAALDSQGQAIIADILPSLRQARRYVIITGSLTIPLRRRLIERLALEEKRSPEDYLVINGELAPVLNAIGVLFGAAFVGAARKG